LSVDDVVSSAFAGQLAAWERLKQRAARGNRESFLAVLDKVPDVGPEIRRGVKASAEKENRRPKAYSTYAACTSE
jgi:hypothetical protein